MDISELTVKLLFLFLPGIITRLMIERLTVPHDKNQLYFFLHAFTAGVLAYTEYGLALAAWSLAVQGEARVDVHFLSNLVDSKQPLVYNEVVSVCAIAIINGFVLSALINRSYLNRFARWLGATKRFGNFDVWGYVCNSPIDSLKWVRVRDHRHDICYEGWVEAFSDTNSGCELFLREVRVFKNESGEPLYSIPGIYLSQDPEDVAIEFYALDVRESDNLPREGDSYAPREQPEVAPRIRKQRRDDDQARGRIQGRSQSSAQDPTPPV